MSGAKYPEIPGLYFVYATGHDRRPDRPDYPYKLEVRLWHPMNGVWAVVHGRDDEHMIVQARTREALEERIRKSNYRTQPRLILLVLSGPRGEIERISRQDQIHPITGARR